jgi:hypothetical protein
MVAENKFRMFGCEEELHEQIEMYRKGGSRNRENKVSFRHASPCPTIG